MAERSFAREVEDLKLGAGQEFRGEGILAITKALLECGVSYVAGYQGAPISHLMDVLSDAQDILSDLGVHFESSASEATAAATHRQTFARRRCGQGTRPRSLPQALERCLRALRREWVSFSTRALRTKLCMRMSFRTQSSFSRLAMSCGIRVASCTSSSSLC